jgi:molybdopterin-guanine dinucleotide biosynthesis protein A
MSEIPFPKPLPAGNPDKHRLSLGLWGTGCNALSAYVRELVTELPPEICLAYYDAHHGASLSETECKIEYFKKNDFIEIYGKSTIPFHHASVFDLLLLNAHHHQAELNCLIVDGLKPWKPLPEVERKTSYVWVKAGAEQAFSEIQKLADFPQHITLFFEKEGQRLHHIIRKFSEEHRAPLHALILTGGKSSRMGEDKSQIAYHGLKQRDYLCSIFEDQKIPYRISCNHQQFEEWGRGEALLPDRYMGFGPLSGMLSAFCAEPGAAWLVVACDLPAMNADALSYLMRNRSYLHKVSAFRVKEKPYPDPLAAIWQPECYPFLLQRLYEGKTCPRRALELLSTHEVHPLDAMWLDNVNTPDERNAYLKKN